MIKYEGKENIYFYNPQDVENILQMIETGNYYNPDNRTQEKVSTLVNTVNSFLSNLKVEEQTVMLERHETEEEARAYFGQEFIDKFDKLLSALDKQQTIVALHGTNVGVCPQICENGLLNKTPSLSSTAVISSMAYGQEDMHYSNYESLLNWEHKDYKGLVIVAVPYECYYKEGLWNHFDETDTSAYGGQDYRIDPDFIVGYIDVEGKNIVINPKYNRQHNYQGYVKDYELFNKLFSEQLDMDNEKMTQVFIDSEKRLLKDKEETSYTQTEQEVEVEKEFYVGITHIVFENLKYIFNSIKYGFPDRITERNYECLLQELTDIQKALPNLKTDEQVKKEQEERFSVFSQPANNNSNSVSNGDELGNWEEDIEWGEDIEWEDIEWEDNEWEDNEWEEDIECNIKKR